MPIFVHLTSHRHVAAIRRRGISPGRLWTRSRGVYAMPVTPNFYVSHQWLRELKRFGGGTFVGVYFRIPDDEPVEIGHYNSLHLSTTAAEAVRIMMEAAEREPEAARKRDKKSKSVRQGKSLPSAPEGFEVIIPRRIAVSEIKRVKALPQVVGWRHHPGAKNRPPCACLCCQRGEYGIGKLMRRVEEAEAKGRETKISLFGREEDSFRRVEKLKRKLGAEKAAENDSD